MFFGMPFGCENSEDPGDGEVALLRSRQLDEDRLVVAVSTLRALALLYLENADVEVVALEVVSVELRQLLEYGELALEAAGRALHALVGETARLSYGSALPCKLVDDVGPRVPQLLLPLVGCRYTGVGLGWRPLAQSSASDLRCGCGGLRLISRFVTLVALADISLSGDIEEIVDIFEASSGADVAELFLPKLNFHLDGFFAMAETGETGEGICGLVTETGLVGGCFDFDFVSAMGMGYMDMGSNGISRRVFAEILEVVRDVLLISRANICNDCDATASVSNVSSGLRGGTGFSLVSLRFVLRAPRFRRLLVD